MTAEITTLYRYDRMDGKPTVLTGYEPIAAAIAKLADWFQLSEEQIEAELNAGCELSTIAFVYRTTEITPAGV